MTLKKLAGALMAAGLGVAAFGAHAQVSGDKVKIGYIPITDAAALLVAHEMGFFKKQGIESAPPTLIRGWSPLVEAFASHRPTVNVTRASGSHAAVSGCAIICPSSSAG